MKYLSHYMEDAQTKAFNDAGAFFAFSQEQMSKKRIKCQVYVSLGAGLYAPKSNADSLVTVLDNIYKDSIKQDIAENGIKNIIDRELANYETQITGDLSDTFDALKPYGITLSQIKDQYGSYYQKCIDNDWF